MNRLFPRGAARCLAAMCLIFAARAGAQSPTPIPYVDEPSRGPTRPSSDSPKDFEHEARKTEFSSAEDTAAGIGLELLGGLVFLEGSKGASAETRGTLGARFVGDLGRLFSVDSWLHESFFTDVTWAWQGGSDGTLGVSVANSVHEFTIAPALELPFGQGSAFGVYGQLGGGVAFESTTVHAASRVFSSSFQPLFQYGVGFRGRPLLSADGKLRLTFRLEVTRLRRSYFNDTLLLGSLGLAL